MNQPATPRTSWVVYVLLIGVIACGAGVGLYFSGLLPTGASVDNPSNGGLPVVSSYTNRFPLTERDAKDTVEAPELAMDVAGNPYLTWASKTGAAERTIYFTRSLDGGKSFETPKAIAKGGVFRSASRGKRDGFERRATPHVAIAGKHIHLTWSAALADGSRMRHLLATSSDAGETFGEPHQVHKADDANPTFTALAVGPHGEVGCAWLGSPGAQKPFAAVRRAGSTDFDAELPVPGGQDGNGVCPCCALAACFAEDGTLYVGFRNLADGYRDIAVSVLKPGKSAFDGPYPVMPPRWKFDGCPHDGPSLAVVGDTLHVVWMDASTGVQRCYHASKRADLKFSVAAGRIGQPPIPKGQDFQYPLSTPSELHAIPVGTQGNAKLYVDDTGRLHAVWEESSAAPPADAPKHQHGAPAPGKGGRAIQHAVLGPDGRFGAPTAVAPRDGAFQTRPCIAVAPDGRVCIAWNELDESGKAVVVKTQEREANR